MSGFCGWVGWRQPYETQRDVLSRMAGKLAPGDDGPTATAIADANAVAVSARHESPRIHEQDGYWVVVQGAPGWAGSAREGEDAAPDRILEGFRRDGVRVLEHLRGGFALAILSPRGEESLLAVDRVGGRFPLCYKSVPGGVVFGTLGDCIQVHPLGRSPIDPQAIYNYLYFHVVPSPRSVRQDVRQLEPASYLRVREGRTEVGTFWRISYRDDDRVSLPELCEEFRGLIRARVASHARGTGVGCFLSGGTDSSTIAGYLGAVTGRPAQTYSIGFDAAGYDEMEYARAAVARFDTRHHEYYVTPDDVVDAVPRIARAYSEPFGNASAVPAYYCARLASRDGIRCMLGGDGGDELFAGNQRYAEQHVFGIYDRVPAVLRRVLEVTLSRFPENSPIVPLRKAASYMRQAKIPMPHRLQSYNYFERTGPQRIVEPDFLAAVSLEEPRSALAQVYDTADAGTMLNRMLALDLKFTIADDDLPKVSRMCDLAGVEVRYPFLDDEMVEFSCRVPARLKLKGLKLRWFFKHALRDFLPEKILRKPKHGFGLPFGLWMREHGPLRDFARDNLESFKRRRLVRTDYIDEVARLHETEHAAYYGVMIWILMMLEQWFQHHEDAANNAA